MKAFKLYFLLICIVLLSGSFVAPDEREPFLGYWKAKCLASEASAFRISKHEKNKKMIVISVAYLGDFQAKVKGNKFTIQEQTPSISPNARISGYGKLKGNTLELVYEAYSTKSGGGATTVCDLVK